MGEYNPAGRLPITLYRDLSSLPAFDDYSMRGRTYRYATRKPIFPFGHGLSYATFAYGKAKASKRVMKQGETLTVDIPVTNTGERDGEEVVQLYVSRPGDNEEPLHALRGFRRVAIAKGQTHTVSLTLTADDLEWYDTTTGTMRPMPSKYRLYYGGTSDIDKLQAVEITYK